MHGYILRYITLGLVIYFRNAFSDLCGPSSIEMASLATVSPTVFEGTAVETTRLAGGRYRVRFAVQRLYKGTLGPGTAALSTNGTRGNVSYSDLTGRFGTVDRRGACVTPTRKPNHSNKTRRTPYIVFLNSTGRPDPDQSLVDPSEGRNLSGFLSSSARGRNVSVFYSYEISDCPENSSSVNRSRARVEVVGTNNNESSNTVQFISENSYFVVGEKLALRCRVLGRRTDVLWYRNGTGLRKGKRLKIHYKKSISTLSIRKAKHSDAGVYHCKSSNTSQESERVTVEILDNAHLRPCDETNFCLNRGRCMIIISLGSKTCTCQGDFTGDRCQEKKTGLDGREGKKRRKKKHVHHS